MTLRHLLFGPEVPAPDNNRAPRAEARTPKELPMLSIVQDEGKVTRRVDRSRMAEWLEERIEAAVHEPSSEAVTLTPVLAELLLDRNPANRPLSQLQVERLASDIKGRRWTFNGEPIIVSRDGCLNDGQHRCAAVVAAGKPIRTMISFGFDRESRMTLDQGVQRTAGHYLGMSGVVDANAVAAIAVMIWQHKEFGTLSTSGRLRPTKSMTLLVAESYKDIADSLAFCSKTGGLTSRTLLAFCHWTFAHRAGRDAADEFMEALIGGANLKKTSPILYARNRLTSDRLKQVEKAELIFRAWNAWREGRSVTRGIPLNGTLPKLGR